MTAVRVRPYGEHALLVELADLGAVWALSEALRRDPPPGVLDVIPAARTVLVRLVPGAAVDPVRVRLSGPVAPAPPAPAAEPVEIAVVYDGDDLAEVSAATGLSAAEVVRAHTGRPWTVAFCGFAPGFAYLSGGDPRLAVARRAEPRTRVPAGSVGLGGEYSAVYPAPSPGGWQLIGRTDEVMWNTDIDRPARLEPGMTVRFRAADRPRAEPGRPLTRRRAEPLRPLVGRTGRTASGPVLEIVSPGLHTTVQDGGRPGYARIGVSRSGAADRGAWARGNRLVGNTDGAAALEATLGGLVIRTTSRLVVALTGATVAAHLDDRPVGMDAAIALPSGSTLALGRAETGLRTYLAVRGGVSAPAVLGSRSRDDLGRLGPEPLRAGDRVGVGDAAAGMPDADLAPHPSPAGEVELRCHPGPRADWITAEALARLGSARWTATEELDRVGVRLAGPRLDRSDDRELPSEGIVRGAVQVPPSGQPLVFLADHPTTGGYPVVAVVVAADTDRLAQVRPGQSVRFRWTR